MEASAQDEYVSDFDLEHLEEVVKREMLEQRRAEAYAHHYQNLQPPPAQQQQQQQPQQQASQSPSVGPQQPQQVHVVSHHSSASSAVVQQQQPTVALKHQLQVINNQFPLAGQFINKYQIRRRPLRRIHHRDNLAALCLRHLLFNINSNNNNNNTGITRNIHTPSKFNRDR